MDKPITQKSFFDHREGPYKRQGNNKYKIIDGNKFWIVGKDHGKQKSF